MTLQFVQVARPSADLLAGSPGIEPSDCVRSYAFMANLAAQEATGDAGASAPAERILTELKGSSEYDTLLFAAVANVGPLGSPSELGFPTVPATVSATATATGSGEFGSSYLGHDYCGFVRVGLPLAEDLDIASSNSSLTWTTCRFPARTLLTMPCWSPNPSSILARGWQRSSAAT